MTVEDQKKRNIWEPLKIFFQKAQTKLGQWYIPAVIALLLFIFAVIGGGGYLFVQSNLQPVAPANHQQKIIEIPSGSSVTKIAGILEAKGMIKSALVFKYYVRIHSGSGFIAGTYQLSPSMTVPEIVQRLKSGRVMPAVTITIPEGKQLREIAAIIGKAINKPEQEVLKKLNDKVYIKTLMGKYPNLLTKDILNRNIRYPLEGYLFPATYPFYKKNPSVNEVATAMLDKTNSVLSGYHNQMIQAKQSPHQLLTLSSLIEEEASGFANRKKIASVFYNRLKKGMPLQTDPTVLYAQGRHKERVYYHDLEVNSPYNTYKHTGLPPGPISNSGRVSIDAALHPAKTDYYYFLASPDGSVIFTKSLAEHNRAKANHLSSKK